MSSSGRMRSQPGIAVPYKPRRTLCSRSSSLGMLPVSVLRILYLPVVKLRGRGVRNAAAGPSPCPVRPWHSTQCASYTVFPREACVSAGTDASCEQAYSTTMETDPYRTSRRTLIPSSWVVAEPLVGVARLYGENDLSERAGRHHRLVGACRIGQRYLTADNRSERAARQAGDESGVDLAEVVVGRVEQGHAENRRIAAHHVARVDLDAATVPDDDDATVL